MFEYVLVNIALGYYVACVTAAEVDMYSRKRPYYRSVLIKENGHLQMCSYVKHSHK